MTKNNVYAQRAAACTLVSLFKIKNKITCSLVSLYVATNYSGTLYVLDEIVEEQANKF